MGDRLYTHAICLDPLMSLETHWNLLTSKIIHDYFLLQLDQMHWNPLNSEVPVQTQRLRSSYLWRGCGGCCAVYRTKSSGEVREEGRISAGGSGNGLGWPMAIPQRPPMTGPKKKNSNTEPRFRLRGSWYIENHISNILKRTLSVLLGLQC